MHSFNTSCSGFLEKLTITGAANWDLSAWHSWAQTFQQLGTECLVSLSHANSFCLFVLIHTLLIYDYFFSYVLVMIQYDSEPCHPDTASLLHYKYHAMLLISVAVSLRELCCGQHVVRHQTAAASNPSDMFVRPSVEDIKTCRAEMNDLLLVNWIMEPGDENQKSRGA